MEYTEIMQAVKNPEKEMCELKSSFSEWEDIAKTIAAFSTKRGGKIFVGIDKRGFICGTTCSKEIVGRLQGVANQEITPCAQINVELVNHDSKKELVVACIHVKKGNDVFAYKGVHYERRDDINHPLNADEIFEIQKSIRKLYFDEMPAASEERPALISDVNAESVTAYLSEIKEIRGTFDLKRFLINHSLTVNGGQQVKNAAIMMFGKEPQMFVPQLRVSICFFAGKNVTDQFVKKEIVGDLYEIFQKTEIELQRNITVYSFIEGMQRFDVPEYPLAVIRECLINALVHRDYFDRNTETFIKMFTDRIEFVNPASFPFENMTFDEIKKTKLSKRRNPLLAKFFESMGSMENEGQGLTRIEELMNKHGLPQPVFEASQKTFMVTIKNSENKDAIKNSPYKRILDFNLLNDRQKILIEYLRNQKGVTISRSSYISLVTSKSLSVNNQTASRDLKELVQRNILTKFGDRRGTTYVLT